MNHYLLRRKYRIFILILVAGSIYLCFQLFSFKVLNFSASRGLQFSGKHSGVVLGDASALIKDHHGNVNVYNGNQGDRVDINKDEDLRFRQESVVNDEVRRGQDKAAGRGGDAIGGVGDMDLPRGTHMLQMNDYKRRSDGMFQCLKSKELIPFSAVNDDYCDCDDATDEPGTAACPESRFYCKFQYPDEEPRHLPGTRVNDGVCDCCDGSDEWQGVHVFSGVHLTDKRLKDSLTHAPCENKCLAIQKSNAEDAQIRVMGRRLKLSYIEAGKNAPKNDLYGAGGVFYQLGLSCFDLEVTEYKYTLCPFKSVSQQKFPQAATNLGKTPVWKIKVAAHGVYVLKMDKGDPSGCPGGMFRNTVITFICGLTDKILQVSENEKCTYSMKFSTPAAC